MSSDGAMFRETCGADERAVLADRWLMLAAEMAGLAERWLAALTGSPATGLSLRAADRHAYARRGCRVSPCRPGLHRRHLAPAGHGRTQCGHRDRGL